MSNDEGRAPGGPGAPGENSATGRPGDPAIEPGLLDVAGQLRPGLRREALPLPARDALRERLIADLTVLNHERTRVAVTPSGSARLPAAGHPTGPPAVPAAGSPPAPPVPRPRVHRPVRRRTMALAAASIVVAAAGTAVTYALRAPGRGAAVEAVGSLAGALSADPASPVSVHFTEPLNHASVLSALRVTPAVRIRSSWQGDDLTISPEHGFAPNTAYVVTVDHSVARTSSGAALASDVTFAFGTAPQASESAPAGAPVGLGRLLVAPATDGSEAVVVRDGSMLLTAAASGRDGAGAQGLVRVRNGSAERLAPVAHAICVSRSGRSVAYLEGSGSAAHIVFADSVGNQRQRVPVTADTETPLGWIGDAEVTFVSDGVLRAVDRAGQVRVLSPGTVDAAHDVLAIAPGGRYLYHAAGSAPGELIDLQTGHHHRLPGITGSPAFSADGATVTWVEGSGASTRLATAASGGGPILSVPVPVRAGDTISDLAVSPTGALLAYTVTRADGDAELRVASLADGDTLGVSELGAGQSPNWEPSGDGFTVLGEGISGPQIQLVHVPTSFTAHHADATSVARAFANAQLSSDVEAQRALTAGEVEVPALPRATRAEVLWVQTGTDGTATARVRLTADATPQHPVVEQAEETIRLDGATGLPRVVGVDPGSFGPAPAGPKLTRLDDDAEPGTALLSFDSDLDPAGVADAVTLTAPDGSPVAADTSYDPATRTISVHPAAGKGGAPAAVTVHVSDALRDIAGHHLTAPLTVTAQLG